MVLVAGNNNYPYNKVDDCCIQVRNCQTATGYLVKSHYYNYLIENYKVGLSNLINTNIYNLYAIDQYWKYLQKKDKWFLIIPLSVIQRNDYSDIEKTEVDRMSMLILNKPIQKGIFSGKKLYLKK